MFRRCLYRKSVLSTSITAVCTVVLSHVQFRRALARCDDDDSGDFGVPFMTDQAISNWSGTHHAKPYKIYTPRNAQEVNCVSMNVLNTLSQSFACASQVVAVLNYCTDNKLKARPVGTALSPNGIGINENYNLISGNSKAAFSISH